MFDKKKLLSYLYRIILILTHFKMCVSNDIMKTLLYNLFVIIFKRKIEINQWDGCSETEHVFDKSKGRGFI